MSSEIVIEAVNISKVYKMYDKPVDRIYEKLLRKQRHKAVHSLHDVSFTVEKGRTVGIIGRNGAGKSTILQIIAGTLTPSSGTVKVKGRVVALLELGAGFNMEFTGEENVYLYASILGLSRDEIKKRYQSILEFAEIGEFINYPVKTYSSGMFVRLAFSVAINVSPEILIIDEALSVGDVQFQHKCMAKLKQLQSDGCTILFVSHDIDSVKSLCDSAVLLTKGKVHSIGTPDDIANDYMELIHLEQLEKRKEASTTTINEIYSVSDYVKWEYDNFDGAERHGLGEAKIVRIQILNEKECETDTIEFSDSLKANVLVEYFNDISTEINVGIMFRDDKGIDILGDDSWNHGVLLPAGKKDSKFIISFHFPHLWLKPGSYMLAIALGAMSEDYTTWNNYYYDWIDRAKVVNVRTKGKLRVWSKVLLPAEVKMIK